MIKYLPFDSELFGYKVGEIAAGSAFSLHEVSKEAQLSSYKLVYIKSLIKIPGAKLTTPPYFDLVLADEKITYQLPVSKTEENGTFLPEPNIYLYTKSAPETQLINLALQSGAFSRFATDPHFKNQEFQKLYSLWIYKLVTKELPEELWVYLKAENNLAGFFSIGFATATATISLLAVAETVRRKGIGQALLQVALTRARHQGCTTLRVITQQANMPAVRFYEKAGFVRTNTVYLYHLWLPQS